MATFNPGDPLPSHSLQLRCAHLRWGDFCQRHKHEGPLGHAWVRHDEGGCVDDIIAVQQNVQVQRARRIAEGSASAGLVFNRLQLRQQRVGSQSR